MFGMNIGVVICSFKIFACLIVTGVVSYKIIDILFLEDKYDQCCLIGKSDYLDYKNNKVDDSSIMLVKTYFLEIEMCGGRIFTEVSKEIYNSLSENDDIYIKYKISRLSKRVKVLKIV